MPIPSRTPRRAGTWATSPLGEPARRGPARQIRRSAARRRLRNLDSRGRATAAHHKRRHLRRRTSRRVRARPISCAVGTTTPACRAARVPTFRSMASAALPACSPLVARVRIRLARPGKPRSARATSAAIADKSTRARMVRRLAVVAPSSTASARTCRRRRPIRIVLPAQTSRHAARPAMWRPARPAASPAT